MNKQALSNLGQFYGTEHYHRYSPLFPRFLLTDGAMYLAQHGGCFWLFDIIASAQNTAAIKRDSMLQSMQFWTLKPHPTEKGAAILVVERDSGDRQPAFRQEIPITDFPFDVVSKAEIWVAPTSVDGAGAPIWVAYLPSEH